MRTNDTRWWTLVPLVLLAAVATPACGVSLPARTAATEGETSQPTGTPAPGGGEVAPALRGGVLVTLEDSGEVFHIWATEPDAVRTLLAIADGTVAFINITGPLRRGAGPGEHNAPWGWHLDPAAILLNIHTFAPVYSGRPSVVEADLDSLLAARQDKMTGPPAGRILSIDDRR